MPRGQESREGQLRVSRYQVLPDDWEPGMPSIHPDRLKVETAGGAVLLDVSMSGDSPFRPFLTGKQPWFFTGSPFGEEIIKFALQHGILTEKANA